jgi:predicted transcriptional regulator
MRQPEVSIAIGELVQAGLIVVTEDKEFTKGRPIKVYHVKGNIAEYLRSSVATRMADLNKAVTAVNRIFKRPEAAA